VRPAALLSALYARLDPRAPRGSSLAPAPLSNAAAAIGVKNRLQKDLDELQRAAKGAATLQADDAGHLLDVAIALDQAILALQDAIAAIEKYRTADRTAKLQAPAEATALLNECFA
jgi:flagellar hook-basal body complex protein FliE